MKRFFLLLPFLFFLSSCGRLDTILYAPQQTPETWLQIQPYLEFNRLVIVQPSTSIIVYLLGVLTIAVGLYFLKIRDGQRSRFWWGIALLLWGLGALLAGTSYEAFSYAIKCEGRTACLWTSWWEIAYLIVSVWSIDAMMLAVAHSSADGKLRKWLSMYALINAVFYFGLVMAGAFIPVKFLISFELLLVVAAPSVIAFFAINGWRYAKYKLNADLVSLGAWLWLGLTIAAYFLYLISGNTAALWAKGIWFSENDVLHIGLIVWMIYLAVALAPRIRDMNKEIL
ncbi:hypothetical protein [Candidatus Villigracilis affinis]|uniref:hypothetical protein n=1 Tax=Candidatus Villigracilis affinis TaxID=3140682 RepID=UPI002A201979|nr:hypothetical protein [Anaerolineales bacterium]